MTTLSPTQSISASDWKIAQAAGAKYGVDPYLLVAIGIAETGWGSQGAGKPPSNGGAGNILGYGAYDSNPNNPTYGGLTRQLYGGAQLLSSEGIHNIGDIQAGKARVSPTGQVRWASGDNASTGYSWDRNVVSIYTQIHGQQFASKTSSAWDSGDAQSYQTSQGGAVGAPSIQMVNDFTELNTGQKASLVSAILAWFANGSQSSDRRVANSTAYKILTPHHKALVSLYLVQGSSDTHGPSLLQQGADALPNPLSWADGLAKALGWLTNPKNWIRIGYVVGGALLILLGVVYFFKEPVSTVAKAVTP